MCGPVCPGVRFNPPWPCSVLGLCGVVPRLPINYFLVAFSQGVTLERLEGKKMRETRACLPLAFAGVIPSHDSISSQVGLSCFYLPCGDSNQDSNIPFPPVVSLRRFWDYFLRFKYKILSSSIIIHKRKLKLRNIKLLGFPGGAVVKNPPANAGDMGSSPSLGRSHMPRSN